MNEKVTDYILTLHILNNRKCPDTALLELYAKDFQGCKKEELDKAFDKLKIQQTFPTTNIIGLFLTELEDARKPDSVTAQRNLLEECRRKHGKVGLYDKPDYPENKEMADKVSSLLKSSIRKIGD